MRRSKCRLCVVPPPPAKNVVADQSRRRGQDWQKFDAGRALEGLLDLDGPDNGGRMRYFFDRLTDKEFRTGSAASSKVPPMP